MTKDRQMQLIDTFALVQRYEKTLGREIDLVINRESLTKQIKKVVPHWSELTRTRINLEAIRQSIQYQGVYPILICAHCKAAGYLSSLDVNVTEVEVSHKKGVVTWCFSILDEIRAPRSMTFHFDLAQIKQSLIRLEAKTGEH